MPLLAQLCTHTRNIETKICPTCKYFHLFLIGRTATMCEEEKFCEKSLVFVRCHPFRYPRPIKRPIVSHINGKAFHVALSCFASTLAQRTFFRIFYDRCCLPFLWMCGLIFLIVNDCSNKNQLAEWADKIQEQKCLHPIIFTNPKAPLQSARYQIHKLEEQFGSFVDQLRTCC